MLESLLLRERLDTLPDVDHLCSFLPSGVPLIVLLPLLAAERAGDGRAEKTRSAAPFPGACGSEG